MTATSKIKTLFKKSDYQDLVKYIESNSNLKFEDNYSLEKSCIFYYYIRSKLELGFLDRALKQAELRYNFKDKTIPSEARLYTIVTYAYALMNKGLYQAITQLEEEGSKICTELSSKKDDIDTLELITLFKNMMGNGYLLIGDLNNAILNYQECLEIRKKIGNFALIADSLLNIGIVYFEKGNYEKGYTYESQALDLYTKTDEKFGIVNTSVNMVILLISQGKWKEAIDLITKTMPLAKGQRNLKFVSILTQMQGDIYENKGNLDQAIKYYNDSLQMKEELRNEKMIADNLTSIGHVYIEKKDYQSALDSFSKAVNYYENSGSTFHIINTTFWIFWTYFNLQNEKLAKFYASQLEEYGKTYRDERTTQICKITEALYGSFSNNLLLKDENADTIQKLLDSTNIIDLKIYTIASDLLCIYKLNKLKTQDSNDLREEIDKLIDKIHTLGEEKNSYKFMVISLILKAKFNLILGNVEVTFNSLATAKELAKKYELVRLINEIEVEEQEVSNKIELWYNNIPVNTPMAEKIDNSNILDYLKDIVNLL